MKAGFTPPDTQPIRLSRHALLVVHEEERAGGLVDGRRMVDLLRARPALPCGMAGQIFHPCVQIPVDEPRAEVLRRLKEWTTPSEYREKYGAALPREFIAESLARGVVESVDASVTWDARQAAGIRTFYFMNWGGLGDVIAMSPLYEAVKRAAPGIRLHCEALTPVDRDIIETNPWIDSVSLRSEGEGVKAGPEGLSFEPRVGLLSHSKYYARRLVEIAADLLPVGALYDSRPRVYLTAQDSEFGAAFRESTGPYVAVHATTSKWPAREWAPERWGELVRALAPRTVVQIGGPSDPPISGAVNARGTPIRRSFAVLERAEALVAIDSSIQHAAAGLGTPAVVLHSYSPPSVAGHPENTPLLAPDCWCHRDIRAMMTCERSCLSGISAEAVAAAVQRKLEGGGP